MGAPTQAWCLSVCSATHTSEKQWAPRRLRITPAFWEFTSSLDWRGFFLPKSGASMPFKDRAFGKQMHPSTLSQEKSFPILEIQFSLGKPPSSESKLSRRFIIHKSFLGIGSLPEATLLSVFSDFRMSIKNFNSWSLSGWWASRYRSKHPAKLLPCKRIFWLSP